MTQFEAFISRHGEPAAQALLENWERFMGIRHSMMDSLEQRWLTFMQGCDELQRLAA